VVEQLAKKYAASVDIFSMNADESPDVPRALKTQFIPLFVFYRDGVEVSRMVGPEEAELEKALSALVPAPASKPAPPEPVKVAKVKRVKRVTKVKKVARRKKATLAKRKPRRK